MSTRSTRLQSSEACLCSLMVCSSWQQLISRPSGSEAQPRQLYGCLVEDAGAYHSSCLMVTGQALAAVEVISSQL